MNNSREILNELKEVSPLLAGMEKINVFQVPEGYFNNLSEHLSSFAIFNTQAEFVYNKTNLQKVPDGYFDTLSTNILAKIKQLYPETANEELRNLSQLLYLLKNENVFTVPEGYFEYSAIDILRKVKPVSAKIVAMKPHNSWLKIAVAAAVTGIIAISSLQIFNNSSNQQNPPTEIAGYVKESFQFKTEQQLDAGIAKLSDDDIIKYLENTGSVLDNDVLLNNIDVTELPAQADYLNDENTLNSYLDKIDQKQNSN